MKTAVVHFCVDEYGSWRICAPWRKLLCV